MWQSRSLRTPSPGVPTCALLSFPWQQAPGWSIPRSALAGGREPGHCSLPPEPWVLATRGWVLLHFCCTCSSSCLKQHQCPAGAVTTEPASAASLLLHLFNLTWGFSTAFLPGKKKILQKMHICVGDSAETPTTTTERGRGCERNGARFCATAPLGIWHGATVGSGDVLGGAGPGASWCPGKCPAAGAVFGDPS